ncbi:ParB/RepB/Spo0J family partition protein [Trichocoleus sp. FACHB-262]|uniref:ParB/RepB/Spo0J family partition protein n=1 Tax=Trichocoleus sp. FACHB-262 TaxID=2692869 RepID=UPI001682263A|nr:ParB/RepB/Spo0J family partition protein [Trichocoleus sp. FACHB-262]MBD2120184.1 ParB N-terminal domain-containing protein [Trichocoleus sp. FACHB-262]
MTNLDKIIAAAQAKQGRQEQQTSFKVQGSTLPLAQIQTRQQDTRPLNSKHVESLAESIAVLGLIEPLVIDNQGRLLAGGHRLAAINHLKETQWGKYQEKFPDEFIPVRRLFFNANEDPELALQIEVAENEQRRDYTPTEVKAIADRLRESGYVDVKGRPKKGQKALMPALAVVVGKHLRTIQRYLGDGEPQEKVAEKSTTRVVLLKQALSRLNKWQQKNPQTSAEKELAKKLPELIKLMEQALDD